MVTPPKPPGSRQLISPLTAVFEIAPANVLQGAVRLHGFASSPTPETQVRDAWALAGDTNTIMQRQKAVTKCRNKSSRLIIPPSLQGGLQKENVQEEVLRTVT